MALDRTQVLSALEEGKSNTEIARRFSARPDTIGKIRRELLRAGTLDIRFASSGTGGSGGSNGDGRRRDDDDFEEFDEELEELRGVEDADDMDDLLDLDDPRDSRSSGSGSSLVDEEKAATVAAILTTKRKRAEFEAMKIERDMVLLAAPPPTEPTGGGGIDMMSILMSQLAAERAQTQMLMGHLLKVATAPPAAPLPVGGMGDTLKMFSTMIGMVDDLRAGGGGDTPQDPASMFWNLAAKRLDSRNEAVAAPAAAAGQPPAAAPGQPPAAAAAAPPAAPTIEDEGKARASKWIGFAMREMSLQTSAETTAGTLFDEMGHLPGTLREAILTQPVEQLVGTLRSFLPAAQVDALVKAVRGSDQNAKWLGAMLGEIRAIHEQPEEVPADA